jgi:hypothetical protein
MPEIAAPVVTPPAAPAPAPAPAPVQDSAVVQEKRGFEARRAWLKEAAQEIGTSSEDGEASETPAVDPKRGKDGKFKKKADAEAKPGTSSEAEKVSEKPSEETDASEAASETKTEGAAKESKDDEASLRSERIEIQNAWTKVNKEHARLRQQSEQLKQVRAEFERLQRFEARFKTEPYKVVEEAGGSLSDWQKRAFSGKDDPRLTDIERMIQQRDAEWQKRFDDISRAQEQKETTAKMQENEQNFIRQLDQNAEKHEALRENKAQAIDMAYDFAENVARHLRGRTDIPRIERPYVEAYLKNVPAALALDPANLMAAVLKRMPKQEASEQEESKPKAASKKTVDNAASGVQASPSPAGMSRKDWIKWAASQVKEDE